MGTARGSKRLLLLAMVVLLALGASCSGGNLASKLTEDPNLDKMGGKLGARCKIKQSQKSPLIVEWQGRYRTQLETLARERLVVVRYDGCEMQLLSRCRAPGKYKYAAANANSETITIRDGDELWAKLPLGAAKLEADLERSSELSLRTTIVGNYRAERDTVRRDELTGQCEGATHVLLELTAGAFELASMGKAKVVASGQVLGKGAGAKSESEKRQLRQGGDLATCKAGTPDDTKPPNGCGSLLAVTVAKLEGGQPSATGRKTTNRPTGNTPAGMVLVPAGDFWMGCAPSDSNCRDNEKPRHQVYLDAFYIDKTEVTVDAYGRCVSAGRCNKPTRYDASHRKDKFCNWGRSDKSNHPINCVSYDDATSYCRHLSKRLPTEAEWEKAARGTDGRIFPWGDSRPSGKACWNRGNRRKSKLGTCVVGSFAADKSPYGVLDMAGNVLEWVSDWYDKSYYVSSPRRNPTGPSSTTHGVIRSESWSESNWFDLRLSKRRHGTRIEDGVPLRGHPLGLRCVRAKAPIPRTNRIRRANRKLTRAECQALKTRVAKLMRRDPKESKGAEGYLKDSDKTRQCMKVVTTAMRDCVYRAKTYTEANKCGR